jgi:hypothetical protein
MSFSLVQMLDQAPEPTSTVDRRDRVYNELLTFAKHLRKHVQQTGCLHCKKQLEEVFNK